MSSYAQNNFGEVFQAIIRAFQPVVVVELGILNGYSTLAIAEGLKQNGRGELYAYDLFEDYAFKHGSKDEVEKAVAAAGIPCQGVTVQITKMDAYKVADLYHPGSVHLLHVDLSNDGETVKKIMDQWDPKMVCGGIILFEGGTEERDQVEWMQKYGRPSLKAELENNPVIIEKYIMGTYLKWPGLTMLLKKR